MVGPDSNAIRRYNIQVLVDKHCEGRKGEFASLVGISASTISSMLSGRQGLSDSTKELIDQHFILKPEWLDENRIPADYSPPEMVRKTRKTKTVEPEIVVPSKKTGSLKFEADGFLMDMEMRGGNEDEAEITRLALRIVEVRSR